MNKKKLRKAWKKVKETLHEAVHDTFVGAPPPPEKEKIVRKKLKEQGEIAKETGGTLEKPFTRGEELDIEKDFWRALQEYFDIPPKELLKWRRNWRLDRVRKGKEE